MGDDGGRWRGVAGGTAVLGVCLLALVGVARSGGCEEGTLSARPKGPAVSSSRPALPDPPSGEPAEEDPSPSVPPGPPAGAEGKRDVDQVRAQLDQVRERAQFKERTHSLAGVSGAAQRSPLVQRLNARGLNLSESQCRELDAAWNRWKDYGLFSMKMKGSNPGSDPNRHAWAALEGEVRSRLTVEQAAQLHRLETEAIGATWKRHVESLLVQLETRLVVPPGASELTSLRLVERRPPGEVPEAQIRALGAPEVPPTLLFPEAYGLTFWDLWELLGERVRPLLGAELRESLKSSKPAVRRR